VFTPNVDGPNPARKWQANNVGDVFVTAEIELDVPVRPAPKKVEEKKPEPAKDGKAAAEAAPAPAAKPQPVTPAAVEPPAGPPPRERRKFVARGHLLVTVPLYVRWNVLEWEDR
jgi:hypothetical protein